MKKPDPIDMLALGLLLRTVALLLGVELPTTPPTTPRWPMPRPIPEVVPHEIARLGLPWPTDAAAIRRWFTAAVRRLHPDCGGAGLDAAKLKVWRDEALAVVARAI